MKTNVMRHDYRKLSDAETDMMNAIKSYGEQFWQYLDMIDTAHGCSRELEIAMQKVEEAVMWGVKHVTGPRKPE